MKKIGQIILAALISISLCGCSEAQTEAFINNFNNVSDYLTSYAKQNTEVLNSDIDVIDEQNISMSNSETEEYYGLSKDNNEANYLFEINDEVEGFVLKSVEKIDRINSDAYMFEHINTGAKLLYLDNDSLNRSFNIGFRTPLDKENGLSHIFEHACISGSEKYPDPNLFYAISSQTFTSTVNASTECDFTDYYFSTMSKEQFDTNMDIYLDSVFNPLIMSDRHIMDREAYRYELADKESDIIITGSVYSEIQNTDLDEYLFYKNIKTLMPNSRCSFSPGGNCKDVEGVS